jgi:hypothetical protein
VPIASLGFRDKLGMGAGLEQGIVLGKVVHKKAHCQTFPANPPTPLLKGLLTQPPVLQTALLASHRPLAAGLR